MNHVPTETDLATKATAAALSDGVDGRFDRFDERIERTDARIDRLEASMVRFDATLDGFHAALRDQTRTYMLTMIGVTASFAAVVESTGILV